jgi:hypothetical protein
LDPAHHAINFRRNLPKKPEPQVRAIEFTLASRPAPIIRSRR